MALPRGLYVAEERVKQQNNQQERNYYCSGQPLATTAIVLYNVLLAS